MGKPIRKNLLRGLFISTALILASVIGWWTWQSRGRAVSQGPLVFEKNCSICHGLNGDGKGQAAYLLQPKPRNFRAGKFRLVSSQNLQPTREDIFRTITEGMPGTAMPSWAHLPASDRRALADYVLKLNRDGWYDRGIRLGYSIAEAQKFATEMTDPGPPILVPPEPPLTRNGLEEGRTYYLQACAKCHGENGVGKRDPTWRTAEGFPTWSRNLKQGVVKGGRDGKQLYLRFFTGLPGTPMPSGDLSGKQVWHVVQYVQSLSDPAAQEQARIRSKEIAVKRLQTLPASPDDAAWDSVPEVRIPLMPLWWREGYIDAVRVKAVHDGQRLAFRLEWNDTTRDVGGVNLTTFPDGAALELATGANPPLFAMGAPGEMVNIWHWKALWDEDKREFQDVGTAFPHMVADAYYGAEKGWRAGPLDDTTYRPAAKVNNPLASPNRTTVVEDANAAGPGTFTSQAADKQTIQGISRWAKGIWRLQLSRNLKSTNAKDVSLHAGTRASVAFAVWDGSAGDRNGQKSVSIWNTLILE